MRSFLSYVLSQLAGFLFFLTFAGIGLTLLFGLIVPSIHAYWRTRDEVTTSATLTGVHLETSGGSRSRNSTVARYRYQYNGRSYEGTELSIFRQTDDFYDHLKRAFDLKQPIRIYVDPRNPSYSVYDREFFIWPLAGGLAMAVAFSAMGAKGLFSMFQRDSTNLPTPRYRSTHQLDQ